MHGVLADSVVTLHIAFLAYLVFGGFLTLWQEWPIWPHAAVTLWSGAVLLFSIRCPLTTLEAAIRERAGQPTYSEPFVEHYFKGFLYPESHPILARTAAVLVVAASYVMLIQRRMFDVLESSTAPDSPDARPGD